MDREEARQILASWRPGIDDDDPRFREALAFALSDPELRPWLDRERETYAAVRARLREIDVPTDLARKILTQRPISVRFAPRPVLQLAAALLILAGVAYFWLRPTPRNDLAHYQSYLATLIARGYSMSLVSADSTRIRTFLASNQSPADYSLSTPLQKTTPLGCATLSWNGNPVSMLCFRDQPARNLWLFVVDRQAIPNHPVNNTPQLTQFGDYTAATWDRDGRTYVLTIKGSPSTLQGYL